VLERSLSIFISTGNFRQQKTYFVVLSSLWRIEDNSWKIIGDWRGKTIFLSRSECKKMIGKRALSAFTQLLPMSIPLRIGYHACVI
jgi:hypothetical protein